MKPLRFVQFSDVHLDSSIGGSMNLPIEKKSILQQDIAAALARACALVAEYRADLVLVPGDLFDFETVRPETASYAADIFRNISPTPVFIAPGNHDSLWPGSPYTAHGGPDWPENVHIFKASDFQTVSLPDTECSVTGIGHAHRGITDRLPSLVAHERSRVSVLLFHGSREAFLPPGKETVIPFRDEELLSAGFTYAAIGHYHSFSKVTGPDGQIRGAYSGCLQGRDVGECGVKFALVGEIDPEGRVGLEMHEVAERRVAGVDLDITGVRDNEELLSKTRAMVTASGARPQDIVCLTLRGAASPGVNPGALAAQLGNAFFHINVNSGRVTPDYDLEELAAESLAPTIKSIFVQRMMELISECEDPARAEMLRDAIYYGLYALDRRALEPRDAD